MTQPTSTVNKILSYGACKRKTSIVSKSSLELFPDSSVRRGSILSMSKLETVRSNSIDEENKKKINFYAEPGPSTQKLNKIMEDLTYNR